MKDALLRRAVQTHRKNNACRFTAITIRTLENQLCHALRYGETTKYETGAQNLHQIGR